MAPRSLGTRQHRAAAQTVRPEAGRRFHRTGYRAVSQGLPGAPLLHSSPAEQGRVPGASLGAKAPASGRQAAPQSLVPGQLLGSPGKGEGHPTGAELIIGTPWRRGVPVLTEDKGAGHLPPAPRPQLLLGSWRGLAGWGRQGAAATPRSPSGVLSPPLAYGLSPLPWSFAPLNSFGLEDELECTRVRACACVGVPHWMSGFSPKPNRSSALSILPGLQHGAEGVSAPSDSAHGCPGRDGGKAGRAGGHCVTCKMLPMQRVISHRSGRPAEGRGPGSPVLSHAMQIVGARQRTVPAAGSLRACQRGKLECCLYLEKFVLQSEL